MLYLDLDLGSGHTAYRRASLIDLYLYTKFHSNLRNFVWTDGPTDGRFPPILLGRLLEVDLIRLIYLNHDGIKILIEIKISMPYSKFI